MKAIARQFANFVADYWPAWCGLVLIGDLIMLLTGNGYRFWSCCSLGIITGGTVLLLAGVVIKHLPLRLRR